MTLHTVVKACRFNLSPALEQRIERRLATLGQRLGHWPEPEVVVTLTSQSLQRRVEADLRVQLDPLRPYLVSHQAAETADGAVRMGVEDMKRQLDRKRAAQRGTAGSGAPSRRIRGRRAAPERPAGPRVAAEEKPEGPGDVAGLTGESLPFLYYG